MIARQTIHLIIAFLCIFGGYLNRASAQPFAYVSNISGNVVTIVNPSNGSILGSVRVPNGPTGLAVTPDGLSVYVTSQSVGSISVLSTANNTVVRTISVGTTPVALAISPSGAQVYVVNQGSNNLSIISVASQAVIATLPVGSRPMAVAFSPDGSRAFVTNLYSSNITVIDTASRSVIGSLAAMSGPNGVAVSPNGRYLFVANQYSNAVTVHDISSGSIVKTIGGFSSPTSLAITPNGSRAFVVNAAGSVGVIDTASNSLIGSIGVGSIPTCVAISPDGTRAYVTNEYSFTVSVIDTGSNTVVSTIPRVGVYPVAVAIKPALSSPAPPPPPTPAPTIGSFSAAPATITAGQAATLSWSVSNATALNIDSGGGDVTGMTSKTLSPAQTTTYTLTASNSAGSVTAHATVTVATAAAPPPPSGGFTPIRVNAGGSSYVDSLGHAWSADTGYAGGNTWSVSNAIANTTASPLYQTCRWGSFSYHFAVPNGSYTVNLKFAEPSMNGAGQRLFNVSLNGTTALTNFDVFAQAGGAFIAIDKAFPVSVTNGQIAINFSPGSANAPMVEAIEVVQGAAPSSVFTPIRVNAGGSSYVDSLGQTWSADTGFAGGAPWSVSNSISGSPAAPLYQTCRYGSFSYQFSAPNGAYTVRLKFAEVSRNSSGQRLFNVAINGTPVLSNFDIYAAAGGEFKAVDKAFPVNVTNGQITILFTPGSVDAPMINAIEIVE